jgi:ZIP family zinc transporter/zinc and cadmium transporter
MEIVYSFVSGIASLFGALLVLKFNAWTNKNSLLLINFAAGVMIAIAFIHLLPESIQGNEYAPFYTLLGFSIMFFLQFILLFHPCHDDNCPKHLGLFSTFGLSLHSFIDGLIIAIGFETNLQIGLLTALAVLFHKMPDGITISSILMYSGMSVKKNLWFSVITSAFTPIGTIVGIFLFRGVSQEIISILLALAAGSFIFLAAADLIPETHKSQKRIVPAMFFVGILFIALIEVILK